VTNEGEQMPRLAAQTIICIRALASGAASICVVSALPALAADLCEAIALRDVAAVEAPDSVLSKGAHDTAITQFRVDKHTGMTTFCSHGGYCYPTHVHINGQKMESLRLLNCKVGKVFDTDQDYVYYSVDVERSKNLPEALKIDYLENRLMEMGLCSACAGNVAMFYVQKPNSPCAQLAKKALEGNPEATAQLQRDPPYCTWWK
jgi:hypothetical protein